MSEPTNINLVRSDISFSPSTNFLTASAFQNVNTPISSDYLLRWRAPLNSTTGYTLSVAYISAGSINASSSSIFINYNTTFLFSNPSSLEYFPISADNPLTINITSLIDNLVIDQDVDTLSQRATAVYVEFSPNFNNTINYAPSNFEIRAIKFNNESFVRILTAVIIQTTSIGEVVAQGPTPFKWIFPESNIRAEKIDGTPYTSNSIAPISSINTMVFYITADNYNYKTQNYTLCTTQLTAIAADSVTRYHTISYDTFPNFDLNLFINYENTNFSNLFYRLISSTPLTASPALNGKFVRLASIGVGEDLSTNFTGSNYNAWFTLNNGSADIQDFTTIDQFDRSVAGVSSVQGYLSCTTLPGTLTSWYSPHIISRSLSAEFVNYFLSGDFIGAPKAYFETPIVKPVTYRLLSSIDASPGMLFYGEGHNETILLSAQNVHPLNEKCIWRVNNSLNQYPVSSVFVSQITASVSIPSQPQQPAIVRIPVSLQLTNNKFLSTSPLHFFNDINGQKEPYPYFISTVDVNGNELNTNYKDKQSITILPYDRVLFDFVPGIDSNIYLPTNGSISSYQASLRYTASPEALSGCYGRYGLIWSWNSFVGCSANPLSFVGTPSSWATVQCSGTFPKQWTQNDLLSTDIFNNSPATCSASNITWTISSEPSFFVNSFYHTGSSISNFETPNIFCYDLSLLKNGGEVLLGTRPCGLNYTGSIYENTNITLNVNQNVTCRISAAVLPLGYSNDWQPKISTFDDSFLITSVAQPLIRIYTPNRYILTDTNITFENLITNTSLITSLVVNLDDNKVLNLTGEDIKAPFSVTYDVVGFKTIQITAYTNYSSNPVIATFPNIVEVLDSYEQVSPSEYRTPNTPIELPWSNKPGVGSNDWAVADNINHWFEKFFDNLNYLEARGRVYPSNYSEYFGYLGSEPTSFGGLTSCEIWTWEDLDCFNTSLPYDVTWRDVLSADVAADNGRFVNEGCSTWEAYNCSNALTNPTCYGLYDVEWSWRSRKKGNTLTPITWTQTKRLSVYDKEWRFQQSDVQPITICTEGKWQVNIPGIDTFYETIGNLNTQLRCIHYGVASKNNQLFLVQKNLLKLHDATRGAKFFDYLNNIDSVVGFSDIKNICLDSAGKIYILDNILSQVAVYTYERDTPGANFKLFTIWGGFGTTASNNKFSNPEDIHIDQLDNVWVTDTGNNCVKHYSNTGTWIRTIVDDVFKVETPLSTAVDSLQNVHILTTESVRVYSYTGEFLFSYNYKNETSATPRKINTSYNREVIYIAVNTQVLKYFRNGIFFAYIFEDGKYGSNITSVFQDEYRNILITADDKVLKFPDLMLIRRQKGVLPNNFWKLEDILIHKEEYIQNWVYTKAFERMWDNIEIFRNTIFFENSFCKGYRPPVHEKNKLVIGQNEIVTSTTINRCLGYLWDNFTTMVDYFNPNCNNNLLINSREPLTIPSDLLPTSTSSITLPSSDPSTPIPPVISGCITPSSNDPSTVEYYGYASSPDWCDCVQPPSICNSTLVSTTEGNKIGYYSIEGPPPTEVQCLQQNNGCIYPGIGCVPPYNFIASKVFINPFNNVATVTLQGSVDDDALLKYNGTELWLRSGTSIPSCEAGPVSYAFMVQANETFTIQAWDILGFCGVVDICATFVSN